MRLRRRFRCADCGHWLRGYEYLTPRGIVCGECFRLTTCRPGVCAVPGCKGVFEGPGCLGDAKLSRGLRIDEALAEAEARGPRPQAEHRSDRRRMYEEGLYRVPTSLGMLPGYTKPVRRGD